MIMAFVKGRMVGGAASVSSKYYCMVGEHMQNSNFFLDNFITKENFL
jgi:hypothetical protein